MSPNLLNIILKISWVKLVNAERMKLSKKIDSGNTQTFHSVFQFAKFSGGFERKLNIGFWNEGKNSLAFNSQPFFPLNLQSESRRIAAQM